jgi:adenylate cyclase class 2
LIQRRVLERNLRFDLPDGSLRAAGRVLRLRKDHETRLTYKGPSKLKRGVMSRREVELEVKDFEDARQLLEQLGYRAILSYEKYRATYALRKVHVMLDELPFGNFVEIEGPDSTTIEAAALRLRLKMSAAIGASYAALFDALRATLRLKFAELSFENFDGMRVTPAQLGVDPADR